MKSNIILKGLLVGAILSVSALAEMTVDKSNGVLTATSTISGKVIAKIIGSNNKILVNKQYEGNSFSWIIPTLNGSYKYNIRIVPLTEDINQPSDYAGGIIDIIDGQDIQMITTEIGEE